MCIRDRLLGFPFVALHIAVGEVEPHQIQLTIIGKKLFDLTKHKFQITVEIAIFIGAFRMVAHWMVHISIVRKIRMTPVYDLSLIHIFHEVSWTATGTELEI